MGGRNTGSQAASCTTTAARPEPQSAIKVKRSKRFVKNEKKDWNSLEDRGVRYIDKPYRLSIYRHVLKISISISISIRSLLKISISISISIKTFIEISISISISIRTFLKISISISISIRSF